MLISNIKHWCWCHFLLVSCSLAQNLIVEKASFAGKDVTSIVFGKENEELFPIAYADFNSDKITDIFALSRDQSTLNIFFGQENPISNAPLFKKGIECKIRENWESMGFKGENRPVKIIGVVAADFTGDSILDVMITYRRVNISEVEVVVFRGNITEVFCNVDVKEEYVIQNLVQEPLALDIDGDMVMDLFGEVLVDEEEEAENGTEKKKRIVKKFWIFDTIVGFDTHNPVHPPNPIDFKLSHHHRQEPETLWPCIVPHANSFGDVNNDLVPELILITNKTQSHHKNKTYTQSYSQEVYSAKIGKKGEPNFLSFERVRDPISIHQTEFNVLGQPILMDLTQNGTLLQLFPFSSGKDCRGEINGIVVFTENGTAVKLPITFEDNTGIKWHYYCPSYDVSDHIHSNYSTLATIILRAGDFNLDGFPDLIGILANPAPTAPMNTRAVIFENIPCVPSTTNSCPYSRTFKLNFDGLAHYHNVTLATFFDIHEDGLVDVILVRRTDRSTKPYQDTYSAFAFQNSPDYDANFMKVMVLSGLSCPLCPQSQTPYGNILSGPVIKYWTTTQANNFQTAVASQFYRSSHMAMDLPYTIFGIGQSPNFIETLNISVSSSLDNIRTADWTQLIPNSQIIIIPAPLDSPWLWNAKLFLTPSSAVLNTALVLIGFCVVIAFIVAGLHYKERKEDLKERQREAYGFHMM